jgi:hypothetical protein
MQLNIGENRPELHSGGVPFMHLTYDMPHMPGLVLPVDDGSGSCRR